VLTPPGDLDDSLILEALRIWDTSSTRIEYAPWGFGSHHWIANDNDGPRLFVTVDHTDDVRLEQLRSAMATVRALADHGHDFVVAPIRSDRGALVEPFAERYAMTVFPYVGGRRFDWSDTLPPELTSELIGHLARLHDAVPDEAVTKRDDFSIPHRALLDSMIVDCIVPHEAGPFTAPMADLLIGSAGLLGRALAGYDSDVARARSSGLSGVITHGEPHQGNTIHTTAGLRIIDWDTALVAPRERDLWILRERAGDAVSEYERVSGASVSPAVLDIYRTRWDLADLAAFANQFAQPHSGDANDEASWRLMKELVRKLG
jgi:spectinomycin phosphotransferase/16S rRNA (guanine(1405)-N(7))-methyltransferase